MLNILILFLLSSNAESNNISNYSKLAVEKRDTCSATTGPNVVFKSSTNYFQRSNSNSLTYYINYTALPACTGGLVFCSVAKLDSVNSYTAALSLSNSIDVTISSSLPIGTYSLNLSCNETGSLGNFNYSTIVPFSVYISAALNVVNTGSSSLIKDGGYAYLQNSSLSVYSTGGVPSAYICYYATLTQGSFIRLSNVSLYTNNNCFFTQKDIDDSKIAYIPQYLSTPGSTSSFLLNLNVWDSVDASNTATATINYNIFWKYYPVFGVNYVSISAGALSPATIPGASFLYSEAHSIAGWDIIFTIPDLSSFGQFEYYCPDSSCATTGWNTLGLGNQVTFAWFIMNAIRWNPKGQPAGSTKNVTMSGYYPFDTSLTFSIIINLSVLSSGSGNLLSVPYQSYGQSCPGTITGSVNSTAPSLPFDIFSTGNSPIRPMCVSMWLTANAYNNIGDLSLLVKEIVYITITGWVKINSDLPLGFSTQSFSGTNSSIGSLGSALYISHNSSSTSSMILITPKLVVKPSSLITKLSQVAVFMYSSSTLALTYVSVNSWNNYAMNVTLPGSGYYIFGTLDHTLNKALPVAFGTSIKYLGEWSSKTFTYGKLSATIKSSIDGTFKISKPSFVIAFSGYNFYGTYLIESSINLGNVALTYNGTVALMRWAYYDTIAAAWTLINNGTTTEVGSNSTYSYSIPLTKYGTYGIVAGASIKSDSVQIPKNMFLMFITLIFAKLLLHY